MTIDYYSKVGVEAILHGARTLIIEIYAPSKDKVTFYNELWIN